MKQPFFIMLLASSLIFATEQPSLFKKCKQAIFGKHLITIARENNCPQVVALLQDLRKYTAEEFLTQSRFGEIITQDQEIAPIIFGLSFDITYTRNEFCFAQAILSIKNLNMQSYGILPSIKDIQEKIDSSLFLIKDIEEENKVPNEFELYQNALESYHSSKIADLFNESKKLLQHSLETLLQQAEKKLLQLKNELHDWVHECKEIN